MTIKELKQKDWYKRTNTVVVLLSLLWASPLFFDPYMWEGFPGGTWFILIRLAVYGIAVWFSWMISMRIIQYIVTGKGFVRPINEWFTLDLDKKRD